MSDKRKIVQFIEQENCEQICLEHLMKKIANLYQDYP
jgi:hypothetical protein